MKGELQARKKQVSMQVQYLMRWEEKPVPQEEPKTQDKEYKEDDEQRVICARRDNNTRQIGEKGRKIAAKLPRQKRIQKNCPN